VFDLLFDAKIIPLEAESVPHYFEDSCFRRGKLSPRFPIAMWDCFQSAERGMPKTNNAVEGWHNDLNPP